MNEQELIELWKSGALNNLPEINFKQFQNNVKKWQRKVKRKFQMDSLLGAFMLVFLLAFGVYDPRIFYFFPPLMIMSIWYYRSVNKINSEQNLGDHASAREFLEAKKTLLTRFIRINRILGPPTCSIYAFASLLLAPEYKNMLTDTYIGGITIGIVLLAGILGGLAIEVLLRMLYVPLADELEELLDQIVAE